MKKETLRKLLIDVRDGVRDVDKPVNAIPMSPGHGDSFNGLSSLLSMLNICSPTVSVVTVDNGFGAGLIASLINRA